MNSDFLGTGAERLAELRRVFADSQAKIVEARMAMSAVSAKVESKDGAIRLTLDSMGRITELLFRDETYQDLEPKELSEVLVELFAEAQAEVRRSVMELVPASPLLDASVESSLDPNAEPGSLTAGLFESMFGDLGKGGVIGRV